MNLSKSWHMSWDYDDLIKKHGFKKFKGKNSETNIAMNSVLVFL